MYILTSNAQYLTAQGTRPYLTTNARLALVFPSAEAAEAARITLARELPTVTLAVEKVA